MVFGQGHGLQRADGRTDGRTNGRTLGRPKPHSRGMGLWLVVNYLTWFSV